MVNVRKLVSLELSPNKRIRNYSNWDKKNSVARSDEVKEISQKARGKQVKETVTVLKALWERHVPHYQRSQREEKLKKKKRWGKKL